MFASRFTILRVRGIPIGVSGSWILIVAFLTWSLRRLLPHTFPGHSPGTYLAMAVACVVVLFASILAHELGHAFRALREGLRIEGITLWLFGGVATLVDSFPSPGAELRITAAGPTVTLALTVVFVAAQAVVAAAGTSTALRGVLEYGAAFNLLLLAFNLVPALPLDGGRILRAWLWQRAGQQEGGFASATRTAAGLGMTFGLLLGLAGVLLLAGGALLSGVAVAGVGLFVAKGARSEGPLQGLEAAFGGTAVRDLLAPGALVVPPSATVAAFLAAADGAGPAQAYPVADAGRLLGMISAATARAVDEADRPARTVAAVMQPAEGVTVVPGDTPALEVIGALQAGRGPAVVTEGGRIAGAVSLSDVRRALQIRALRRKAERINRLASRRGLLGAAGLGLAALLGLGVAWHPPVYVLSPGPAQDVSHDLTITGTPARVPGGEYLLTTVAARQHTLLRDVIEMVRDHRELVTTGDVGSLGVQVDLFHESRVLAAVVAGRAAGLAVTITGSGAEVSDSPASSGLHPGDVIVAVNGTPVHTEFDLAGAVAAQPPGTRFTLSVLHAGHSEAVTAASSRIHQAAGGDITGLAAQVLTKDAAVTGPFTITFKDRAIGGPSAGLAYALAISDALGIITSSPGRAVAATGSIDISGTVGDVGGVELKAIGAREQGADLFLVPADEAGAPKGLIAQIRPVTSLQDALAILKDHA